MLSIFAILCLFFAVVCLPMAFDEHGSRRQKTIFGVLAVVFWFGFIFVVMH